MLQQIDDTRGVKDMAARKARARLRSKLLRVANRAHCLVVHPLKMSISFLGAGNVEAGHAFAFVGDAFAAVPAFRIDFPAKVLLLLLLCFNHLIRLMMIFNANIIVTLWCHDHSSWFNLVIILLLEV